MKILLVSTSFPLNKTSSSGIFVKKLADSLSQKHSITVLTPSDNNKKFTLNNTTYPIVRFKYAPYNWSILAHQTGGIPAIIKKNPLSILLIPFFLTSLFLYTFFLARKYDIIHANWSITGLICGIAARLSRKKVIVTLRGSDVSNIDSSFISRFIVYNTLKICHANITVSDSMSQKLKQKWPQLAHKIFYISNGVDKDFYNINSAILTNDKLNLLFIGNLVPNKSVDTIIKALAPLSIDFQLIIIGDGHEKKHLETLTQEYNIKSKVVFSGQKPAIEIPGIMEKTDIVIQASFSEGKSNVLLEAMASGRLIIASDIPANRDLIQNDENGLLFPPGNHHKLTQILNNVNENKTIYSSLAKNAKRNMLRQNLTWSESASTYNSLYQTLSVT